MSLIRRSPVLAFAAVFFAAHGQLLAVPMRFLAMNDEIAGRKLSIQSGEKLVEIKELHPSQRTPAIAVAVSAEAPPKLVATDRAGADGKPAAVELKMDAGIQHPLVLIVPNPKDPTGVMPFVVEDATANFPWGSVRVINASGRELSIQLEKSLLPLPNSWKPVDIKPGGEPRNVSVKLLAKGAPKPVYSAVWEHNPDFRKLAILVQGADARTGAVDVKIIPENRKVAEADAAAARQ